MADTLIGTFTVSVQADQILLSNHGLINGDQILFKLEPGNPTAALPFPLNTTASYVVVGARGNDFQVASVVGGAVINITDKGVGANQVWRKGTATPANVWVYRMLVGGVNTQHVPDITEVNHFAQLGWELMFMAQATGPPPAYGLFWFLMRKQEPPN